MLSGSPAFQWLDPWLGDGFTVGPDRAEQHGNTDVPALGGQPDHEPGDALVSGFGRLALG